MNFSFCRHLLVLGVVFVPLFVFSQKNYVPGYVIVSSGDTLRGSIDNQEWTRSPRKVNITAHGAEKTYTLEEIAGFGIDNGDQYVKQTVSRSTRTVDIAKLDGVSDKDSVVTEPVLLRRLTDGQWKLYYLEVEKPLFFLQVGDGASEELLVTVRQDAVTRNYSTYNTYRDQVNAKRMEAGMDATMPADLALLPYKEKEMTAYFRKLNGAPREAGKGGGKVKAVFFAGTGIALNSLKMEGNFFQGVSELEMKGGVSPTIQAGIDLASPRNRQRFVFRAEVTWFQFAATHYSERPKAPGSTAKNISYDLKTSNIQPSISLLYHVMAYDHFRAYIGIGYAQHFTSYSKNIAVVEEPEFDRTTVKDPMLDFEKSWGIVNARMGAQVGKHFDAALRYGFFGSFSAYSGYDIAPRTLMLQVNYRF